MGSRDARARAPLPTYPGGEWPKLFRFTKKQEHGPFGGPPLGGPPHRGPTPRGAGLFFFVVVVVVVVVVAAADVVEH